MAEKAKSKIESKKNKSNVDVATDNNEVKSKKKSKPICRNSCKNVRYNLSDESKRKGLCKQCYFKYLEKQGRQDEIPVEKKRIKGTDKKVKTNDVLPPINSTELDAPDKLIQEAVYDGIFLDKIQNRNKYFYVDKKKSISIKDNAIEKDLGVKIKQSNWITKIEKNLTSTNKVFNNEYFIRLYTTFDYYSSDYRSLVKDYYIKLFSKQIWLQSKRECETYRKTHNQFQSINYQDYVLGHFLLKLDSIILECKLSKMIEVNKKINCTRNVYSFINIIVDPRTLYIVPNKITKICNEFNKSELSSISGNYPFKTSLEDKLPSLTLKYNNAFNGIPNSSKIFLDNEEERYFSLIAQRITAFDMITNHNFSLKKYEYMPLTELAYFNSQIYGFFVRCLIVYSNIPSSQIEYLSFYYLVRITLSIGEQEFNSINLFMFELYYELTYCLNMFKSLDNNYLVSKYKLILSKLLKHNHIYNNKKVFDNLMKDLIDHRKIRMVKKSTARSAKTIIEFKRQIADLKKVFGPKYLILGNKLKEMLVDPSGKNVVFIDHEIKGYDNLYFYIARRNEF